MRVLLADDDSDLRGLIADAITSLGADVVCVSSGGELEDQLTAGRPFDIVVTDVTMPVRTGLEVMHWARATGIICPVVVMTALRDDETVAQVAALGDHVALLHKPFSRSALQRALTTCMSDAPPAVAATGAAPA
ncbi:MAG: response regulator [Myxococcales bacterium]|nr:response regulator [Myxococcales bacterium]